MNLVSLLILPAVINLQDNDSARFTIAGGALVILLGAIAVREAQHGLDDRLTVGTRGRGCARTPTRELTAGAQSSRGSSTAGVRGVGPFFFCLRYSTNTGMSETTMIPKMIGNKYLSMFGTVLPSQ